MHLRARSLSPSVGAKTMSWFLLRFLLQQLQLPFSPQSPFPPGCHHFFFSFCLHPAFSGPHRPPVSMITSSRQYWPLVEGKNHAGQKDWLKPQMLLWVRNNFWHLFKEFCFNFWWFLMSSLHRWWLCLWGGVTNSIHLVLSRLTKFWLFYDFSWREPTSLNLKFKGWRPEMLKSTQKGFTLVCVARSVLLNWFFLFGAGSLW